MQKLDLQYGTVFNGKFSLGRLNFLFFFQVNCPGCFLHGFPLVNQLYREFHQRISFLGISTAFEDFGLNTQENTRLLLEQRGLVGETKKAFQQQGTTAYPVPIPFPVAMDKTAGASFDYGQAAARLASSLPNFQQLPPPQQAAIVKNALNYLRGLESISLTFTLNQLRGTPTFIIINDRLEILHHSFGHTTPVGMKKMLTAFVDQLG
ncbi:MAG: hypothetical protein M9954_09990 [Cyclobacteriaceae bacterium]|nr:hypothetical protein [Cyclobacteriaceae bacterium]MCB9238298.1 hypothetical protein [Flammeovirgaceae bacterium]MCB0499022.1 hypothetical protein [Cyclobacteriaceae bacterium]MCO5271979.1 hypothetical protein [Cyclobacteriaceae bacterium]MCW5902984.1 hypothetical protein [Cyclobacteriaceae bacterium]